MFKARDKRIKKRLKKYRNAQFDYSKYVKQFYVEDGNAYISCRVHSINDIISSLSIKGYEWINKDFANYIEENAYYIPVEYPIIIEICGHHFEPEEQELIIRVVKDYFGLKLGDKNIDLDINSEKSGLLLLFGFMSLGLVIMLSMYNVISLMMEIGFISLWFFLWEFADLAIIDRYDLLSEKTDAGQLASMKIIFNENEK